MLSIRGLMVHSARWTAEMMRINNVEERMTLCGYGVPDENAAVYSNENAPLIFREPTGTLHTR